MHRPIACGSSQVLDAICHLVGVVYVPEKCQTEDDFAQAPALLLTVRDSGVLDARRVESKEIAVLGKEDSPVSQGECDVVFVGGPEQPGLGRCRDVDASPPQARG